MTGPNNTEPVFQLVADPIPVALLREQLSSNQAGAVVSFEGCVRDSNNHKQVSALEYQTDPRMCQREADKIIRSIKRQYDLLAVSCAQRIGLLSLGDVSIWIGVAALHRKEAVSALDELITAFKHQLPIWKKEFYADGTSDWLAGRPLTAHVPSPTTVKTPGLFRESDFYIRQNGMFNLTSDVQSRLKKAKVLVVGAGGLGSAVLTSLAQIGMGTLGICEGDSLELSNLHRQSLYVAADVGQSKTALAGHRLKALNPWIHIVSYPERLSATNFEKIAGDYDLILDCTDNLPTKFLINDGCVRLQKPVIQASIFQLQGEIRGYYPGKNSACLRCHWPSIPPATEVCSAPSPWVINMTPAIVGHLQALEAVKYFLKIPGQAGGGILIVDLQSYQFKCLQTKPRPTCAVCNEKVTIAR